MRGHMIYFENIADSAYFCHNDHEPKRESRFFESLGPMLIKFEVKPSIQKSAYGTAVSF